MKLVRSADGTPIACGTVGTGPVVVVVNGAMSTASDARGIADALAGQGFTGVVYDRRARGESGNTRPYVPEREVEDLAAVIEAAGGRAAVLGHSSGAIVALFAASRGVSIEHLFLSEPPFRFGVGEPDPTLPERLQQLVDDGHRGEAVTTFQLEGVGLPKEIVEQIRSSPMFDGLVAIAQSVVYDATIARDLSDPTAEMVPCEHRQRSCWERRRSRCWRLRHRVSPMNSTRQNSSAFRSPSGIASIPSPRLASSLNAGPSDRPSVHRSSARLPRHPGRDPVTAPLGQDEPGSRTSDYEQASNCTRATCSHTSTTIARKRLCSGSRS